MPRTRPPYPEEFRREAIRLARLGDKPQRKLAEDLGISDVTLRHWLKEEKTVRGERPGGLSGDEREELNRLRDENATLRMEREINRQIRSDSPVAGPATKQKATPPQLQAGEVAVLASWLLSRQRRTLVGARKLAVGRSCRSDVVVRLVVCLAHVGAVGSCLQRGATR